MPDDRDKARSHDLSAIGTFKVKKTDSKEAEHKLVGHIPVELSFLAKCFLTSWDNNSLVAEVTGPRKCENGLIVQRVYRTTTAHSEIAKTLHAELVKAKGTYKHMNINVNDFQLK